MLFEAVVAKAAVAGSEDGAAAKTAAVAQVEREFSAMNIVKTDLRNRMGDEWLNESLLAYVEKDIFDTIDRETIMQRFQNMKPRRGKL
ncbi:hypothetical protein Dsin_007550 [Dipteronia sinensis]|uniref:Uncharacterized protein n=1 Tax=Dipteronia sinensis TaxID=43782 RepID=A0AAE0B1B2_9ROSI|nr:hypothetical protein Dsin_007550 [Dipteronia sinensis]